MNQPYSTLWHTTLVSTLLGLCSSCTSLPSTSVERSSHRLPGDRNHTERSTFVNSHPPLLPNRLPPAQQADNRDLGVVRISKKPTYPAAQSPTVQRNEQNTTGISLASHEESAVVIQNDSDFPIIARYEMPCPPDYRTPSACENPLAPGIVLSDAIANPNPSDYRDEYLCDGGDRAAPMHFEGAQMAGLETQDTVGLFKNHRGKQSMRPSSSVCIYAPRFGAIRAVSQLHEDAMTLEVADVNHGLKLSGLEANLKWDLRTRHDSSSQYEMRNQSSGLHSRSRVGDLDQVQHLEQRRRALGINQDIAFLSTGRIQNSELAWINEALQAGMAWSKHDMPIIAAKTDARKEIIVEAQTAEITFIDDTRSNQPGELRLLKFADKRTAKPGDEIEFTIRYDNLGARELTDVRIVDNLTPRLEYIEGSAQSEDPAELLAIDNGEGSVVLSWSFTESLGGKHGGKLTFRCRVR